MCCIAERSPHTPKKGNERGRRKEQGNTRRGREAERLAKEAEEASSCIWSLLSLVFLFFSVNNPPPPLCFVSFFHTMAEQLTG